MNNLVLVFLGGGIGSVLRFGISEVVKNNFKTSFPLATLFSNIISCIILAVAVGYFSAKLAEQPALRTLIVVGVCGGFSTFSTFSFETVELLKSGNAAIAVANILVSISACMAIIYFLTKHA